MNRRERIMTALRKKRADKLPWVHYDVFFPRGEMEREMRNRGTGLIVHRPFHVESRPNVEVTQTTTNDGLIANTYHTPEGSVTEKVRVGIGVGQAGYGLDWKGVTPRRMEYIIKTPEDYDIARFIVEDTSYEPYYEAIKDAWKNVGDDGIVIGHIGLSGGISGYSPFQKMLIDWVGVQRLYTDFLRNKEKVLALYEALDRKYEEMYRVALDAPTDVLLFGDNIDGEMDPPHYFEKYCVPAYNKFARIVHRADKIMCVHMDGRLKELAPHIGRSEVDVVEAFTPPPLGNFPINEALAAWPDKVVWMNYPSSIYMRGPEAVRQYLKELLVQAAPGDRVLLTASTENYIDEECLMAATRIMEEASLPLTEDHVAGI